MDLFRPGKPSASLGDHGLKTVRALTVQLDAAFDLGEFEVCEMLIERLYDVLDDRAYHIGRHRD